MNVAYLYLKKSEFKQSVEYLERAKRVAPDNADVYKLDGWAYYGMNRPDQAVAEWKKSVALKPDIETQAALDKALRDKQEEESYRKTRAPIFSCVTTEAHANAGPRSAAHAGGTLLADRIGVELFAARSNRSDFIYAARICRHYTRAGVGGSVE